MEPQRQLGSALRHLRELAGLGIDDCASQIGLPSEELREAEEGFLRNDVVDRLAAYFGMQREELESGTLVPAEDRGTVFLLQGSYQDFNAEDLAVLCAGMNEARIMSALDGGESSLALRRRMEFVPVRVAGPNPKDAAQQGHKLARLVRSRLGLGADAIGDIRELLEDRLGIAVRVDELVSDNLRAASIVDADRAAAAAVLAAFHPEREKNPVLARVYLAHELGHVLFDPASPGTVRLALEDRSVEARGTGNPTDDALLESRAKGFAAELLLPLDGLRNLLGEPKHIRDIATASIAVNKARETFETSFEIAARHLQNLGFLHRSIWENALKPTPTNQPHTTRLPSKGERSLRLRKLMAHGQADLPNGTADILATRARESATDAAVSLIDELIAKSLIAARAQRTIAATDLLVAQLDELLMANELKLARILLKKVNPHYFPPPVLTGLLTILAHAPSDVDRRDFQEGVRNALRTTWSWTESRIASLEARLK